MIEILVLLYLIGGIYSGAMTTNNYGEKRAQTSKV
jgi:hypothetical protein